MIINFTQEIFFYFGIIGLLFTFNLKYKNKKIENKLETVIKLCFGIYVIKVLSLVFFPIELVIGESAVNIKPIVWINPFDSIRYILSNNSLYDIIYNFGGNLVLFIPLPIFLIYFFRAKVDRLNKIVLICFFISLGIECLQYIESVFISTVGRFFETNDIFLNTIGGALGYILYDKHIRRML